MSLKRLSPLRYPGGKAKILDAMINIIECNACQNMEYMEPYAGGAGVALGLLIGGYVKKIHINDIDKGIYSFWYSIINETDSFIQKIIDTDITIQEWHKQKYIYSNLDLYTKLEVGFATFFLNRCNRSGIITGGCIGGQKQDGTYKIDARFNKSKLIEKITTIAKHKKNIKLYNKDTLKLLGSKKIDPTRTILYLDPPYYVKGFCLYKNYYSHKDHMKIKNKLAKYNYKWIVSYDNVEEIKKIYTNYRHKEFNIQYSAGNNKQGKEIMFFSDDILIPEINFL